MVRGIGGKGSSSLSRFGVSSLASRVGVMVVVILGAAELLLVTVLVLFRGGNPFRLLRELSNGITVGDAWAFLGILAALVIAMQIAVWSERHVNDRVTRTRYRRFVAAATLTGAVAIVAWLLFLGSFGTKRVGEFLLVTLAVAGIVLFAADSASLVLRRDRRVDLRASARIGIRRIESTLRSEYLNLRHPAVVATGSAVALAFWTLLAAATVIAAIYIGTNAVGENAATDTWNKLIADVVTMSFVFLGWGCLAVGVVWAAARARATWIRRSLISTAVVLYLFPLVGIASVNISAIGAGQPVWASAILSSCFAIPVVLPTLALTWPERAAQKSSWWQPRGAVRLGAAAIGRLSVESVLREASFLDSVFEEESGTPAHTTHGVHHTAPRIQPARER